MRQVSPQTSTHRREPRDVPWRTRGTRNASQTAVMSLAKTVFLASVAVGAALAGGCTRHSKVGPSVQRTLSSLPDDRFDQNDALESANARPTPETRKPLPPDEQVIETNVATAAAIVGSILSTSQNTVVGIGGPIEIMETPDPFPKSTPKDPEDTATPDPKTLVPWLKFPQKPGPTPPPRDPPLPY